MLKILLLTVVLALHPVHVTLLSIEYSADDNVFNGFLKVYYDDFLLDYKLLTGNTALPDIKGAPDEAKKMIADYVNGKVAFIDGKKKIPAEIKDIDLSGNELRMNLKFIVKRRSVRYEIINSILTDIYRDQSNLLIFRCDDYEEAVKLTSANSGHVFIVK